MSFAQALPLIFADNRGTWDFGYRLMLGVAPFFSLVIPCVVAGVAFSRRSRIIANLAIGSTLLLFFFNGLLAAYGLEKFGSFTAMFDARWGAMLAAWLAGLFVSIVAFDYTRPPKTTPPTSE